MQSANASPQSGPDRRQSILVVDDETDICNLNAEVLSDSGYLVNTAKDGAEAWEAFQLKSYDLLITDNEMPKMSGVELLQKLHAAHMNVPAIMVTGTMPKEVSEKKPGCQLEAVLLKPYALDELLGKVKKVLNSKDCIPEQMVPPSNLQSPPSSGGLHA
jgi:DNA-binding response OmpR family regulator